MHQLQHQLQHQLAAIDRAHPYDRKLLICPDMSHGRELLAALARTQGAWVGWEVTTLRAIADALSLSGRARLRLRRTSDIEIASVVDTAFDSALERGAIHPSLVQLSGDPGTRRALFDAVQELRMGAVAGSELRLTGGVFSKSLSELLDGYEEALARRALVDSAGLFQLALTEFDVEFPLTFSGALIFMLPTWRSVGLPAQLRAKLETAGARQLTTEKDGASTGLHVSAIATRDCTDAIHNRGEMQFFHASTASDELLFVLRQALARGAHFDDVEIACSNVDSYGVALDAICRRAHVRSTMLAGIPLMASRVGRAVGRLLDWLESGFNAAVLRRALEAGDYSTGEHSGAVLAKELRRARAGWGREQTGRAARRMFTSASAQLAKAVPAGTQADLFSEGSSSTELSIAARRRTLAMLVLELLQHAPTVRDATNTSDVYVECADVARAIRIMVDKLAMFDASEQAMLNRVRERLDEIASGVQRRMPSAHALSYVRSSLSELRAWTSSDTARPRRAAGGHIFLTDLAHAGITGRSHLFMVGLDAENVAGPVVQSSLLPDSVRSRFPDALRTTEERRRMRAAQVENAIASTNSRVCLSYAISVDVEGAERSPSHQFLDAWRKHTAQPHAGYDDLRAALGPVQSAVPLPEDTPVDARDLWLQLLQDPADSALLRNADALVRTHFPAVARGLDAIQERRKFGRVTAWHGLVPEAGVLDPRRTGDEISPSSLEAFAACPMRWFYRDALGAQAPRDLEFDEARWLDAAQRGSLLHEVFDAVCRQRLHEQDPSSPVVVDQVVKILRTAAETMSATVPPPGAAVYEAEVRQLQEDVMFFLFDEHTRWQQNPWEFVEGEMRFGGDRKVAITLDDGTRLLIRGRVDRVDRAAEGLRIIDHKTGNVFSDWNDRVPFAGGRRLQLAVYAAATAEVLGEPVTRAEYRFGTIAGGGSDLGVDAELIRPALRVVNGIVHEIANGRFLPTFDRSDCGFCDYASVCRSVPGLYGNDSPRASWANDHRELDEYGSMREWRAKT